jgi:ABC-2 type transport system permease protein
VKKSFKIWWFYTANSFQQMSANRLGMGIFLFGKIFRILSFFLFLSLIFFSSKSLGGYTPSQAILFYLIFNLIDTTGQLLFREVYRFRQLLVSGDLDLVLVKPLNPLVRVLLGGADLFDLIVLAILLVILTFYIPAHFFVSWNLFLGFLVLFISSLLISAAFHITILTLGILFISIDHLVMIYRDLTALMRIPADVYAAPLRFLLTFIIPLAIMFTFPAKALMGLVSFQNIILCLLVAVILLSLSYRFWLWSLKSYQSASS